MKTMRVNDWIRRSILCGLDVEPWGLTHETAQESAAEQQTEEFFSKAIVAVGRPTLAHGPVNSLIAIRHCKLLEGHFRYERLGVNTAYCVLSSARDRLDLYYRGGNTQHLADALNLLELEWLFKCELGEQRPSFFYSPKRLLREVSIDQALRLYLAWGNRWWLCYAAGRLLQEWCAPTVAGAHYQDTVRGDSDDVGGVPER